MKVLITVVIGLLVVGCGKGNQTSNEKPKATPANNSTAKLTKDKTNKETPSKGDDNNSTTAKPVKELTLREEVIGEYERQNKDGKPVRWVVLKSGVLERYINGNKYKGEDKWSISREGKFHCEWEQSDIGVFRINQDVSLTCIAYITKKGKRKDHPEEKQFTFEKIK